MVRLVYIAMLASLSFGSSANTCYDSPLKVKSYPNPVENVLNISVSGSELSTTYVIRVLLGKVIIEKTVENGDFSVNVNMNGLSRGVYVLTISNNKESISQKIIKK